MVLWISFKQLFLTRNENNGVKNPKISEKLSSLKKMAIGRDIPIEAVKARCRELGVTINEFVFAIIS